MKSINIIIPYFGRFPNYFQLFLNSCAYNPTINWTIITDDKETYNYPQNVKVIEMNFDDLQEMVQNAFDFNVRLDKPYKLCDFRPAYGYIFSDINVGYDYWGHSDLDLIYGNIRSFLNEKILSYDKIFDLGHFTLYKNTQEINCMFMRPLNGESYYKTVLSSPRAHNFDERFLDRKNINDIFQEYKKSIYNLRICADIYTKASSFYLDLGNGKRENRTDSVFIWDKGDLYRLVNSNGSIQKENYLYIHLQKRKMKVNISTSIGEYKIIPNEFDEIEVRNPEQMSDFRKIKKYRINAHYFRLRSKNLKTKIYNRLAQ